MVIRCKEDHGIEMFIAYGEMFDQYEERVFVQGVITGEERAGGWFMNSNQRSLGTEIPEDSALWLHENEGETLFHSAYPTDQAARFSRFDLTGIDRALWQVLPCNESKFVNFAP